MRMGIEHLWFEGYRFISRMAAASLRSNSRIKAPAIVCSPCGFGALRCACAGPCANAKPLHRREPPRGNADVDAPRSHQSIELVPAVSPGWMITFNGEKALFSPDIFLPENKISPP